MDFNNVCRYSAAISFSFEDAPILTSADIQQSFEEIFHQYGVDVFMTGHVHLYERQWPLYKNKVTSKDYNNTNGGITHIGRFLMVLR